MTIILDRDDVKLLMAAVKHRIQFYNRTPHNHSPESDARMKERYQNIFEELDTQLIEFDHYPGGPYYDYKKL